MDFGSISSWLKETIPGIILLGAVGSLFGAFILWLLSKAIKALSGITLKILSSSTNKVFVNYFRQYLTFRATFFQLKNKRREVPLIVLHISASHARAISMLLSWILFLCAYFNFLLFGTEYLYTSILLVALLFMAAHDALINTVYTWMIEHYLYQSERDFATETYATEDSLWQEMFYMLRKNNRKLKEIDPDKLIELSQGND